MNQLLNKKKKHSKSSEQAVVDRKKLSHRLAPRDLGKNSILPESVFSKAHRKQEDRLLLVSRLQIHLQETLSILKQVNPQLEHLIVIIKDLSTQSVKEAFPVKNWTEKIKSCQEEFSRIQASLYPYLQEPIAKNSVSTLLQETKREAKNRGFILQEDWQKIFSQETWLIHLIDEQDQQNLFTDLNFGRWTVVLDLLEDFFTEEELGREQNPSLDLGQTLRRSLSISQELFFQYKESKKRLEYKLGHFDIVLQNLKASRIHPNNLDKCTLFKEVV